MYLKLKENTKIIYILHLKQHMEMQRAMMHGAEGTDFEYH